MKTRPHTCQTGIKFKIKSARSGIATNPSVNLIHKNQFVRINSDKVEQAEDVKTKSARAHSSIYGYYGR